MKSVTYILILIVFILGQAGCSWIESPASREARTNLLAQIEITQKTIQKKQKIYALIYGNISVPEFDCSRKGIKELKSIRNVLQKYEILLDDSIRSASARISEERRKEAYCHNKRLEFNISPNLSVENLVAIVQLIEDCQVLDPYILSISITGTNTVEVMTGEDRGPLNGNGRWISMVQKNGEWIINHNEGVREWIR